MQGLKLRAGESLVAMTVLPPALAEQVKAEQAAAKAEAAVEDDDAAAEDAAAADAAAEGSSADEGKGPWLLLITRRGTGKRVLLSGINMKLNRGAQGNIGIKLAPGRLLPSLTAIHFQLAARLRNCSRKLTQLQAHAHAVCCSVGTWHGVLVAGALVTHASRPRPAFEYADSTVS